MPKLHQIIAVASGKKTQSQKAITEVYHSLQRPTLFEGLARTYRPKEDDGDKLPSEAKRVQYRVSDALRDAEAALVEMYDVILTQEIGNQLATADVTVDGVKIFTAIPVTYLLFLDKRLTELRNFIEKLPTLDPAYEWHFNDTANCYSTPAVETTRTKKIPRNHVLAEATDKHPAQVQVYHEDVVAGYWSTTTFSGAIPAQEKEKMLTKLRKLHEAVTAAREQANSIDVVDYRVGKDLFNYLFH